MGKLIRLTGVNFVGAPKLKQFDEIESNGSLFLFDAVDMQDLPNSGQSVPNRLKTITGSLTGQSSNLDCSVNTKVSNNANWKIERSIKGGVHGIIKQNTGNTTDISMVFNAPIAVRNYILANPNRQYYVSIWQKVTKAATLNPAIQSPYHFSTDVSAGTNGFFNSAGGRFNDEGGNRLDNILNPNIEDSDVASTGLNRFNAARYSGVVNNGQALTSSHMIQFGVGSFGPWAYFNNDKGASRIIYRVYMEDLTTSGRTFAEVSALDQAMFDKAFAVGGRFYNDSYTDPNSI